MIKCYNIIPIPKPRMTQSDRWNKRACVIRYRSFCDQVRALKIQVPEAGATITFFLPMPQSWSTKKKKLMNHQPHQTTPDKDNLEKALLDAVYSQDCHIWDSRVVKRWAYEGSIVVDDGINILRTS